MNAIIRNPFGAGGYSLTEMTQAINILPILWTRLGEIGLFAFEGVTQRTVIIEQGDGAERPALGTLGRACHRGLPAGARGAFVRLAVDSA